MTSTITKETYAKIETFDYGSEDETKEFMIRNFYIDNTRGHAHFRKFSKHSGDKFKFKWTPEKRNAYTSCCTEDHHDYNNYFYFTTFEDFEKEIKKQYVCKYHSHCPDNCSVNLITSPQEICAICLNNVQIHLLEETTCGHRFCLSCLHNYVRPKFEREEPITCPTCRRNIDYCSDCNNSKYECLCEKSDE